MFRKGCLKKKIIHKLLSAVLSATLVCTLVPQAAFAEVAAENGPEVACIAEEQLDVWTGSESGDFVFGDPYARSALAKLEGGADYVKAYDAALACAKAWKGGSAFNASYGADYGFSMMESKMIADAICNDHPEFFWWWSNEISPSSTGFYMPLKNAISETTFKTRKAAFEKAAQQCIYDAAITDEMSDYEKSYTLYCVLIGKVSYNINYLDQSAYAALVENTAVCAGYAKAYTYLLQRAGIQASYVPGWAQAGQEAGGHAWVLVRLDGKYYYSDPTLDDGGTAPNFHYFNLTESQMNVNHQVDDLGYSMPTENLATESLGKPAQTVMLTTSSSGGGQAAPAALSLVKGSPAAVTLIPEEGYEPVAVTIGGQPADPVKQSDGTWKVVLDSVSADTSVSVTFTQRTETSLTLSVEGAYDTGSGTLGIKEGTAISMTAALQSGTGAGADPLGGAEVTFSIKKSGQTAAVLSETLQTGEDGKAKWILTGGQAEALTEGSYTITATYAGEDVFKPSAAEPRALTVVKGIVYDIAQSGLTIAATRGGALAEGSYSYDETKDILSILTEQPVTLGMQQGKTTSATQIVIGEELASAEITLENVTIDRSALAAADAESTAALFNGSRMVTAAGQFSDDGTNVTLHLIGENAVKGADKLQEGLADGEFTTITTSHMVYGESDYSQYAIAYGMRIGGELTVDGSGKLTVAGGFATAADIPENCESYRYEVYGIFAKQMTVEAQVDVTVTAAGTGVGVGVQETSQKLLVDGGDLSVKVTDIALSGLRSRNGVDYDYVTLQNEGSIKADVAQGYHSESSYYSNGMECMSFTMYGGKADIKAEQCAIANTMAVTIYDGLVNLDAPAYFKNTGNVKPRGGVYTTGSTDDNTVYGVSAEGDFRVVSFEEGENTLYKVVDIYPIQVSGGIAGTDYEWKTIANTGRKNLEIKTDRPLTLSDNEYADGSVTNYSVSYGALSDNSEIHLVLDNVFLDRSSLLSTDNKNLDIVIDAYSKKLYLTLKGNSEMRTAQAGTYAVYGIRADELVIDGTGTLAITSPDTVGGEEVKLISTTSPKYGISETSGNILQKNGTLKLQSGSNETSSYMATPLNCAADYIMDGGVLTIQSGTSKKSNYAAYIEKDFLLNDGNIHIEGAAATVDGCAVSPLRVCGNLTMEGGILQTISAPSVYQNMGLYATGNVTVNGGTLDVGGAEGTQTWGLYSDSGIYINNGTVQAAAGDVLQESSGNSVGLFARSDILISGGEVNAMGGKTAKGVSYGITHDNQNGNFTVTGGTVMAVAADAGTSFGIKVSGYGKFSGGSLTAFAGTAPLQTVGIACSGPVISFEGTEIVAQGGTLIQSESSGDIAMSSGMLVVPSDNGSGGSVTISAGKLILMGESGATSYGLYVYDRLTMSGGKLQAGGNTKPVDVHTAVITGGEFSLGDRAAGTVYGYKVGSGCTVINGSDKEYPFLVKGPTGQAHAHSFASSWTHDATSHWHACTGAGCSEVSGKAAHSFDGGVITKAATEAAEGVKTYTCQVCKYQKTEAIAKLTPSGSGQTGDKQADPLATNPVGSEVKAQDGTAEYEVTGKTEDASGKEMLTVTYTDAEGKAEKATKVEIPATVVLSDGTKAQVTEVAPKAFENNKKVKTITIGKNVKNVGTNAFAGCKNLTTVKVSGTAMETIGAGAFKNCSKLKSIIIGKNVSKIGKNAFYGDKKLKSITFKTTKLTKAKVGKKAFANINKNATVYYPKSLKGKKLTAFRQMLKKGGMPNTVKLKKK
ncbi:MAG: leucine-rich repeat protein [Lachnospiraceae bacterium]|nr:leucine-rich repeat protein [Lachnospiraceae bacterium]